VQAKSLVVVDLDDDKVTYNGFPAGTQFGGRCVPELPKHAIDDFKERLVCIVCLCTCV